MPTTNAQRALEERELQTRDRREILNAAQHFIASAVKANPAIIADPAVMKAAAETALQTAGYLNERVNDLWGR